MSLESQIADLVTATNTLTGAVNVSKATLDQKVASASTSAATATTKASEAVTKADAAAGSAASALAIYGNTTAMQTAVAQAAAQASVAAGHAASASSVVQQDLSGVNAAALHRSPNAVTALFVYDTSKDSDGGAWTEKCQHTSWYNEPLSGKWLGAQATEAAARAVSGATTGDYFQLTTNGKFYKLNATSGTTEVFRGNKADFPRLAAIVAEAGNVTIYDLTEPGGPMWMRFITGGTTVSDIYMIGASPGSVSGVVAGNNVLALAEGNAGQYQIEFLKDQRIRRINADAQMFNGNIAQRNMGLGQTQTFGSPIVNGTAYAVAMTVLPDAPVDPVTDLQVPTIAVATNGGISVIKHDGTVVSSSSTASFGAVKILPSGCNLIALSKSGETSFMFSNVGALQNSFSHLKNLNSITAPYVNTAGAIQENLLTLGGPSFITHSPVKKSLTLLRQNGYGARGSAAYITNTHNTGHMTGDIRRAYLADTDAGALSSNTIFSEGFETGITGWTAEASQSGGVSFNPVGTSVSWDSNSKRLVLTSIDTNNRAKAVSPIFSGFISGKTYEVILGNGLDSQANVQVFVHNGGGATVTKDWFPVPSGTARTTFVASGTSTYLSINAYSAGVAYIDNIIVREAVADRSYKANSTSISGTLTKSAVASAAQLVAYSGFSAANYLQEPYSADLDFGTGEWTASAWLNDGHLTSGADAYTNFRPIGSNLVSNGTFDTDTTGWTAGANTLLSTQSGGLRIQETGGSEGLAYFAAAIPVVGKTYRVELDKISGSTGAVILGGVRRGLGGIPADHKVAYITAENTQPLFIGTDSGTGSGAVVVDNITMHEVDTARLLERAYSSGAKLTLSIAASGRLTATAFDGTTTRTVTTTAAYNTASWLKAEACYTTDGTLSIRVNGQQVAATYGAPLLTLNNANAVLTIGNSYTLDAPFPGSLALLKLSATVPTAEQSAWMYEQEKQMFRENARVCLPDSGAIVDLTYDDATDKWIAVSATNESEWSGLVRTSVKAVPAGSFSKVTATSGVKLEARTTTNPGVDITVPAYGLREELVKRSESAARLARNLATFDYVGGFTANTTTGSTSITSVAGLSYPVSHIGAQVTGTGIPTGTVITAVNGTTIYLSKAATATGTTVQISFTDFTLPVGYEAKAVLLDGVVKKEGNTSDFTRLFDGFKETIRLAVTPSYTAKIQIQATRSIT